MASESTDAMMRLENRALDNHIEMQIRDGLDEIQALNARHEAMDQAQLLQAVQKAHGEKADGAAAEVEILASADRVIWIEDDQPLLPSARFCAGKRIELNKSSSVELRDAIADAIRQRQASKQRAAPPVLLRRKKRKLPGSVAATGSHG